MIYLRRLKAADFSPTQVGQIDHANSWKVYGICQSANPTSLHFSLRLQAEGWSQKDAKAALESLLKLLQRAPNGQPLKQVFDDRQCHWALSFRHGTKEVKIWRLWVTGIVRLFFCYGPDKVLIVAWALRKREDKLSGGEKTELETIFSKYFDALESGHIRVLGE